MWRSIRLAILVSVGLVLFLPSVAQAHALLVGATPPQDAVVKHEPAQIHLWFSEDLNPALSRVIVWDVHRHEVDLRNDTITGNRELTVSLRPGLPAGTYLVLWTSVSSEDGHVLKGAYLFSIGHRGPAPAISGLSSGSSGPSFPPDLVGLIGILARWIQLATAAIWLGLALFAAIVLPVPDDVDTAAKTLGEAATRRTLSLLPMTLTVLFLATAIELIIQANTLAGGNMSATFSGATFNGLLLQTDYGHLQLAQQALVLVAFVLSIGIWRLSLLPIPTPSRGRGSVHPRSQEKNRSLPGKGQSESEGKLAQNHVRLLSVIIPWPRAMLSNGTARELMVSLAAASAYVIAASGHASTVNLAHTGTGVLTVPVLLDWVHVLASGIWAGGIIVIAIALIPALRSLPASQQGLPLADTLDRFSPLAYASVAALILTGAFNGKVHIPSWYALFNSIYGRTLVVKMALVLAMLAISAFTVYIVRPRLRRALAVRPQNAETRFVAGFLQRMLTRWLQISALCASGVFLATAVMNAYPVPATIGASTGPITLIDHHGAMTITLKLSPGRAGLNTFTILLRRHGKPVPLADERVLETMLDMNMGTQYIVTRQKAPGVFVGQGDVSMGGQWQFEVITRLPNTTNLEYDYFRTTVGS
jgi:copper transport protein